MRQDGHAWLPLAILASGGLGAWLLVQGRADRGAESAPAVVPRVPVVEAVARDLRLRVRAHGSVTPAHEVELVAEVAGRVVRLAATLEPGEFVEAGERLVELEREDAELALERADAALERRRSEWRLALARLERRRSLAASEVASRAQIEEAEHAERSGRAVLREARAVREAARRDLDRTQIAAPFAARVHAKHVDEGQFVSRGTPLARLQSIESAEVRLPVSVAELANLELPLSGGGIENGPPVTLRANLGHRSVRWPARVVRVEGELAPRSRMLHVVARVADPFGREAPRPALAPGLFVEAEIEGILLRGVFVLPPAALVPPDELMLVDAEDRLQRRRVEVLRVESERVIVGRGLAPGERVCIAPLGTMEGQRVRADRLARAPLEGPP